MAAGRRLILAHAITYEYDDRALDVSTDAAASGCKPLSLGANCGTRVRDPYAKLAR